MTAPADLGRAWADAERLLTFGWHLALIRFGEGRYMAKVENGTERRWAHGATPDEALELLVDGMVKEAGMAS